MDKYIGFVLTLFLLSMICERLADFLKNLLSEVNEGWATVLRKLFSMGNLVTKGSPGSTEEESRAYRILKINIFCGFITAFALHADLFSIVKHVDDPFNALSWDGATWVWQKTFWNMDTALAALKFFIGCFATGFFISFGSKFWHDMLDLLYQTKNIKRIQADPETFNIDNIKALDKTLGTFQSDFIRLAYLEAKTSFMNMANVKAFALMRDPDGYYFELSVKQPVPSVGNFYQYVLDNGTQQSIRLKTVDLGSGDIEAHMLDLSAKIFASKSPSNWGTLGCIVRSQNDDTAQRYLLTCCHNVIFPLSGLTDFKPDTLNTGTLDGTTGIALGKVSAAVRDHEVDAALIRIDPQVLEDISNSVPEMSTPQKPRALTNDEVGKVPAIFCGAGSGAKSGPVSSLYADVKISYNGNEFQLINLIAISDRGKGLSKRGDSGSVVLDDDSNVLGLIVGGSDKVSYVIPINTLLKRMEVQLV